MSVSCQDQRKHTNGVEDPEEKHDYSQPIECHHCTCVRYTPTHTYIHTRDIVHTHTRNVPAHLWATRLAFDKKYETRKADCACMCGCTHAWDPYTHHYTSLTSGRTGAGTLRRASALSLPFSAASCATGAAGRHCPPLKQKLSRQRHLPLWHDTLLP